MKKSHSVATTAGSYAVARRTAVAVVFVTMAMTMTGGAASAFVAPSTAFSRIGKHQEASRSPDVFNGGTTTATSSSSSALFMGTNRRARRSEKKLQNRARNSKFRDAIKETAKAPPADDDATSKKKKEKNKGDEASATAEEEIDTDHTHYHEDIKSVPVAEKTETAVSAASSVADAPVPQGEDQPEISTVVIDEDTGFERIAQGKAVMDVVTKQAVTLSDLGPEYRMAQFSPGVPPDVRAKHRITNEEWASITVTEIVNRFEKASMVPITNETTGVTTLDIPPHPMVSNTAIDFVLANRDLLGMRMKKLLGRLKLKAQSENRIDDARRYRQLWKHFLTLENHISAPFRQMVMDSENKIGPQFGNLDLESYAKGDQYERAAAYVVLKGMVAHWEQKYKDAQYSENNEQTDKNYMTYLGTGDPKRYLPNSPVIFKLDECTRICAMAQKMASTFVNTTSLFDDLPVEMRFLEMALSIRGGTELRRFLFQEFCPRENVDPDALREGIWRLYQQMSNMQIDPYGDLTNVVGRMAEALTLGTDLERDPYESYLYNLKPDGPGYFQTYTFNAGKNSLIRFMDNSRRMGKDGGNVGTVDDIAGMVEKELYMIVGGGGNSEKQKADAAAASMIVRSEEEEVYEVPEKRGLNRPHEVGWLNWLEEDRNENTDIYESDNWREVVPGGVGGGGAAGDDGDE